MSSSGPGLLKQAWFRWKSLRLPWRRQFLVGSDLAGNTFWEFRDALNAGRWRRIVKYSRSTHFGDVKISPQWHQWLRHTRDQAPSIQEQQYDVSRQAMMKQLAAQADERWKSVPSYLDAPQQQQPAPAVGINETEGPAMAQEEVGDVGGVKSAVGDQQEVASASDQGEIGDVGKAKRKKRDKEENPWQQPQRGAPSENWQPGAWTPGVVQRR